ncbi:MAG TPA: nucleoside deaminase [Longimicrobiales bacterium]|nr:nucleoside deaminase [Longimicrobiales bacterium]
MGDVRLPRIRIELPAWAADAVAWQGTYASDEERMRVAIDVARENVLRDTGGPFGAAIFEQASGRLVALGVNLVVPLDNSALHAEMVAFMMAQARLGRFTLGGADQPAHTLYTSCEPCAMCLGATLWAGVRRVLWAATREDANRIAFDEGPVFPESYQYLEARGIAFGAPVLREEGRAVLELYRDRGGLIYNG